MATQKRTRGDDGRIYQSKPADTTYQGAARSIGFNPVKAANDEKKMRDYKAAIVADGQTISREIGRQQEAENLALKSQQVADQGAQKLEQFGETANQKNTQLVEKGNLENQQLRDRNQSKLDFEYQKGKNALELGVLKANAQVDNANLKVMSTAINGMLNFAGSVVKYGQTMNEIAEKEEAEKLEQMETDALLNSYFGSNWSGVSSDQVEQTNAAGEVIDSGQQSESIAYGDAAAEVRAGGTAQDAYQAEQIESMSSWNQLAGARGDVFAATMMYPAFLAEAKANGLIRPGAQGYADIQALNRKFAKATGLLAMAQANPKFVADNFSRQANAVAQSMLTTIATENAKEIRDDREAKVNNNIATAFSGLSSTSTAQEVGAAWEAANAENVRGLFGGRMSAASTRDTTKKVLKELADSGRTAEIIKLKGYAPNPNTPNLTLGGMLRDDFDAEILRSRDNARKNYRNSQAEQTIQANEAVERYWRGEQTPETLRQVVAELDQIGGADARRLKDTLVQNGYEYDPNLAAEIASRRGTEDEYSVDELREFYQQGKINKKQFDYAISLAPDTQIKEKIDEAIKLYKPEKDLTNDIKYGEGEGTKVYGGASPAFKQELATRQARFKIDLSRRLQGILRSNPDLDPESREFQQIVDEQAKWLRQQPQYQIEYKNGGFSFRQDARETGGYAQASLDHITIAPGVQDFSRGTEGGLTITQVMQANIPRAYIDPTEDIILNPDQIASDSEKLLRGELPSNRTTAWARFMGMDYKSFVDSQRLQRGMPALDALRKAQETPMPGNTPSNVQTPISDFRDQARGQITYDTGQPGIDVFFEDKKFPAVLSGRVKEIGSQYNSNGSGYGNFIVIESVDPATGDKVDVLYGHLAERPNLTEGQLISEGQIIGTQGGTGSVQSVDGTIASIDFLAPAARGSGSMTPYKNYDALRRRIASYLTPGGPTSPRQPSPVAQSVAPGNKTNGVKALVSLGMPIRGAGYLSSAIQHESAWNAQRPSWTLNDGAGRNGGLLSWNRGRLANLERRYGRPVEQITEAEQLQFLMGEMKSSYPESYRVFMNPNASSADLQWATYNYIRWDKRYTGSRWTMAEGLIRWGNNNL